METATKFKPILLYQNEKSKKLLEEHVQETANKLNQAVKELELFLGVKLNDTEKLKALKEGVDYVKAHLKKSFQFPKATDEFNMQAMGVDISVIKPVLDNAKSLVSNVYIEINNDKFQVSEKGKGMIVEQCSLYTANEEQNKCYNLSLELCTTLNKAKQNKYISDMEMNQIEHSLSFIRQSIYLQEFKPNHRTISSLNENGKFMS